MRASLGLDLSASDAKIARARVHLESLKRELTTILLQRNPYSRRLGEIDNNSGWASIFIVHRETVPENLPGILVGECVNALRSSLDYIVTALVAASPGVDLTNMHQFPIYRDRDKYIRAVGNNFAFHSKAGCMRGVVYGAAETWSIQPFERSANPLEDPLWMIYVFSNADKHRVIATMSLPFQGGMVRIGSTIPMLEQTVLPDPPEWEPNREYEVARVRFQTPIPENFEAHLQGELTVRPYFRALPFADNPAGYDIGGKTLEGLCDHVAMVTDIFKAL